MTPDDAPPGLKTGAPNPSAPPPPPDGEAPANPRPKRRRPGLVPDPALGDFMPDWFRVSARGLRAVTALPDKPATVNQVIEALSGEIVTAPDGHLDSILTLSAHTVNGVLTAMLEKAMAEPDPYSLKFGHALRAQKQLMDLARLRLMAKREDLAREKWDDKKSQGLFKQTRQSEW